MHKMRYNLCPSTIVFKRVFSLFFWRFGGKGLNHTTWTTVDVETTNTEDSRLEVSLPLLSVGLGAAAPAEFYCVFASLSHNAQENN